MSEHRIYKIVKRNAKNSVEIWWFLRYNEYVNQRLRKGESRMKQFFAILAVIASVAALAVVVLQFLPAPATIREDFICED